jgi:dTDP-4-dehydrorhamnose reductase
MTSGAESAGQRDSAGRGSAVERAYLIAGADGMLGTALQCAVAEAGDELHAPNEADFDITDPVAVRHRVAEFVGVLQPGQRGVLINAAAYTNVERAQDEPERAHLVNERGPALLAHAAREVGIAFVHLSSGLVFSGHKDGAYTELDKPDPLSAYGVTKLAGEVAVAAEYPEALIVRTAWVFGPGGTNFPVKILEAARSRPSLSVVTDEIGSPTYTIDLARGILGLIDADATGLFHLAGSGSCSRFELALEVLRRAGVESLVQPVTHDAFPMKAERPLNSVLDCGKAAALGVVMPDWHDAVARFIGEPSSTIQPCPPSA